MESTLITQENLLQFLKDNYNLIDGPNKFFEICAVKPAVKEARDKNLSLELVTTQLMPAAEKLHCPEWIRKQDEVAVGEYYKNLGFEHYAKWLKKAVELAS